MRFQSPRIANVIRGAGLAHPTMNTRLKETMEQPLILQANRQSRPRGQRQMIGNWMRQGPQPLDFQFR